MDEALVGSIGALALIERINSLNPEQRAALDAVTSARGRVEPHVQLPVKIGILTALEIEAYSVQTALQLPSRGTIITKVPFACAIQSPVSMQLFEVVRGDCTIRLVVAQALRMGNNSASIAATSLMYEFPEITDILMVGIAGGIPSPLDGVITDQKLIEDHVRLGDIFIADAPIVQYDYVKREVGRSTNRNMPNAISPRVSKTLQHLRMHQLAKNRPWEGYLRELILELGKDWKRPSAATDAPRRYGVGASDSVVDLGPIVHPQDQLGRTPNKPLVHYGRIGSANTLLKDPRLRDELRTLFGVRAVEMEGSGVADAAWGFGAGYGVVRGICDYCDPLKDDRWQKYAAAAAAAYCRAMVDDMVEEQRLRQTRP